MKHGPILMILAFSGVAIGYAQDEADVAPPESNQLDARLATAANDASQTSQLQKLGWMVGRWVDRGENSTITTECSWTKNGKFLSRSFRVSVGDQVTLEGTQMVGWDPIKQCIRSWTFDSEGGFGEGRWIQDGNRWLVKTSFVLANGDRASAINVITHVDQDTIRWQSTNREVAGELQPNIPEVTVVRQNSDQNKSPEDEKKEVSQ